MKVIWSLTFIIATLRILAQQLPGPLDKIQKEIGEQVRAKGFVSDLDLQSRIVSQAVANPIERLAAQKMWEAYFNFEEMVGQRVEDLHQLAIRDGVSQENLQRMLERRLQEMRYALYQQFPKMPPEERRQLAPWLNPDGKQFTAYLGWNRESRGSQVYFLPTKEFLGQQLLQDLAARTVITGNHDEANYQLELHSPEPGRPSYHSLIYSPNNNKDIQLCFNAVMLGLWERYGAKNPVKLIRDQASRGRLEASGDEMMLATSMTTLAKTVSSGLGSFTKGMASEVLSQIAPDAKLALVQNLNLPPELQLAAAAFPFSMSFGKGGGPMRNLQTERVRLSLLQNSRQSRDLLNPVNLSIDLKGLLDSGKLEIVGLGRERIVYRHPLISNRVILHSFSTSGRSLESLAEDVVVLKVLEEKFGGAIVHGMIGGDGILAVEVERLGGIPDGRSYFNSKERIPLPYIDKRFFDERNRLIDTMAAEGLMLDDFQYFFVPEGRVLLPQGRKLLSQETTRFVPFDPGSVVLGSNSEMISKGIMWSKDVPIKVFPPSLEELNQFEKIRVELGLEISTFSNPPLIFRREGRELFFN